VKLGGIQIQVTPTTSGVKNYLKMTEMIFSYIRKIEKHYSTKKYAKTIYKNFHALSLYRFRFGSAGVYDRITDEMV
jgi:hypothetical protein